MTNTVACDLYQYWDQLRGSRSAPERADIDPAAIRHILGDTFIIEIDRAQTLPFRLAGTRICALLGQELRGVSFLDRWSSADALRTIVTRVSNETCARKITVHGHNTHNDRVELELMLLPLRHHGKLNSRLLGSLAPAATPHWIGLHPLTRLEIKPALATSAPSHSVAEPVDLPSGARRFGHLAVFEGGKALATAMRRP